MPSGPKSNKFTNRHAVEARMRNDERETAKKTSQAAAKEDAMWKEDDPKMLKKLAREREEEEKARQREARKSEKKDLLEQEEAELASKTPAKVAKRLQQKDLSKMLADYEKEQQRIRRLGNESSLEATELPSGNPNVDKGLASVNELHVQASGTVGDVVKSLEKGGVLSNATGELPDNRHIGKRAKAIYKTFYQAHLEELKAEKPGLRRTQYNDLMWEKWLSSASNPFVMRAEMRDAERMEMERRWREGVESSADEEGEEIGK